MHFICNPLKKGELSLYKYKYEMHLHTCPVSKCGKATVEENLAFYQKMGYTGVFVTNHFLDGNINIDASVSYRDKLDFYLSDYYKALDLAAFYDLQVFFGVELSYKGTDFLVYGLDPDWYYAHPEIMDMKKTEELPFMIREGGLTFQAHPYREASYIDHIRLFPRSVQGVEVINACRNDLENRMAEAYAEAYGLIRIAGSDNHIGPNLKKLAGTAFAQPLQDMPDFLQKMKDQQAELFFSVLQENGTWSEKYISLKGVR